MSIHITSHTKSTKHAPYIAASIKGKLQVLNTCLQINRGLMDPDAFTELDKAMDDILKELHNER